MPDRGIVNLLIHALLMLHGRPLEEALLYRVAYAYEQATPWHTRHPLL